MKIKNLSLNIFGFLLLLSNFSFSQRADFLGRWKVIEVINRPITEEKLKGEVPSAAEGNLIDIEFLFLDNHDFQIFFPDDPHPDFIKLDSLERKTWRFDEHVISIDSQDGSSIFNFMWLRKYGKHFMNYTPLYLLVMEKVDL